MSQFYLMTRQHFHHCKLTTVGGKNINDNSSSEMKWYMQNNDILRKKNLRKIIKFC